MQSLVATSIEINVMHEVIEDVCSPEPSLPQEYLTGIRPEMA